MGMAEGFGTAFNFVRNLIGQNVQAIGFLVRSIADVGIAVREMIQSFSVVPAALRPRWMTDALDAVAKGQDMARGIGKKLEDWGKRQQGVDWTKDIEDWFRKHPRHKFKPGDDDWDFNPWLADEKDEKDGKDKQEKAQRDHDPHVALKDSTEAANIIGRPG